MEHIRRRDDRELGEQLAGWGKVVLIETRGRRSGRPARAAVGFVEEPDGSLLVAAGDPDADWALNLVEDPICTATIAEVSHLARAEPIDGPDRSRAVRDLILKYGTPAERLGNGLVFRLRPVVAA